MAYLVRFVFFSVRTLTLTNLTATEFILSGIYVCGPSVNTGGSLAVAWDVLVTVINSVLFLLAVGRFVKHALDMRRMLGSWKINALMGVLVRDSIVYFALYIFLVRTFLWTVLTESVKEPARNNPAGHLRLGHE